ncbi:hypothetical protein BCE_4625 [Bacillus cereus ATCC 10987]|uniref:Uncharacterized protein n=1 Tax=Bacillus cereus (strain ATCC 10987 / NRS 248) TaxID=222523 RepID=Q72ZP3_BACC1|nr:hypothetical protein BCE_4625 [Bacillus cereus ATCC 10987]
MKLSNVKGHWRWSKWKEFVDVIYRSNEIGWIINI